MNIFDIQSKNRNGSALIIVVVLVVMLAIVGFTFVMLARLDAVGSESIAEVRQMDGAVQYVVDRIGDTIAADAYTGESYDYPGTVDSWLASIEPYFDAAEAKTAGTVPDDYYKHYKWRQISDVFSSFPPALTEDVNVDPSGNRQTIDEYQKASDVANASLADADGDGVADSLWARLDGISTDTGASYYVAVRIIDNSGLMNVNTAYKDGRTLYVTDYLCDGASQLNTNLDGLLNPSDNIETVFSERGAGLNGTTPSQWLEYKDNVVDRLSNPAKVKDYAVFGTSDELSLRNRFCINGGYNSKLEQVIPDTIYSDWGTKDKPYMGSDYGTLLEWCTAITGGGTAEGIAVDPDIRHLLTAMSKSKEMTPVQIQLTDLAPDMTVLEGKRKAFINTVDIPDAEKLTLEQLAGNIYYPIKDNLAALKNSFGNDVTTEKVAWNFALNLIDYQDIDTRPSYKVSGNNAYFGFEGIDALRDDTLIVSEVAYFDNTASDLLTVPAKEYFAIEIYNPSDTAKTVTTLNNYYLTIVKNPGSQVTIDMFTDVFGLSSTTINPRSVIVLTNDSANATTVFGITGATYQINTLSFVKNDLLFVYKVDWPASGIDMPVDQTKITLTMNGSTRGQIVWGHRRDEIGTGSGILMPGAWDASIPVDLGTRPNIRNSVELDLSVTDEPILNIGEIGRVFAIGAYLTTAVNDADECFAAILEKAIDADNPLFSNNPLKNWGRFDFTDENVQGIFNYLTVFRTAYDGIDNDGKQLTGDKPMTDGVDNDNDGTADNPGEEAARYRETLVHGRVNVNTAPAAVLEQLPWMTEELAQAIIARRDAAELLDPANPLTVIADYGPLTPGYSNIAQILGATNNTAGFGAYDIQNYGKDGTDLDKYPDFDPGVPDGFTDDYKERDILFHRISNSITVKSDVFTAYILLRAGKEGRQQRLTVIYDRSNVYESGDKPEVIIQQASQLGQ